MITTSKIKECRDNKNVGDDDGGGHHEDDARLRERLQREHDFRAILGVVVDDHSRSVPGPEHAAFGTANQSALSCSLLHASSAAPDMKVATSPPCRSAWIT